VAQRQRLVTGYFHSCEFVRIVGTLNHCHNSGATRTHTFIGPIIKTPLVFKH
jgi:hypothetical protein